MKVHVGAVRCTAHATEDLCRAEGILTRVCVWLQNVSVYVVRSPQASIDMVMRVRHQPLT